MGNKSPDRKYHDVAADALWLMSKDNYWDAFKILFDFFLQQVISECIDDEDYPDENAETLEKNGITLLKYASRYLEKEGVKDTVGILDEFRYFLVFFSSYSRVMTNAIRNAKALRQRTFRLLTLCGFLFSEKDKNDRLELGRYFADGNPLPQNNLSKEIDSNLKNYFDLYEMGRKYGADDFWKDLEAARYFFLSDEILNLLKSFCGVIEEGQVHLSQSAISSLDELKQSGLDFATVPHLIEMSFKATFMANCLARINQLDIQSGKFNKFKKEKEKPFHSHIYSVLASSKDDFDLVISEFNISRKRYDILFQKNSLDLSCVLEAKVGDFSDLEKSIKQLRGYLQTAQEADKIFSITPEIGILAYYWTGDDFKGNDNLVKTFERHLNKINHSFIETEYSTIVIWKDAEDDIPIPIIISVMAGYDH